MKRMHPKALKRAGAKYTQKSDSVDVVKPILPQHGLSTDPAQIDRIRKIRQATVNLGTKTAERKAAEKARDAHINMSVDDYDFLAEENISEQAEVKYKELCAVVENAITAEQQARRELWSAKYDTMTDTELQAVVDDIKDEEEKTYAIELQENRTAAARQKELEKMSAVSDPDSEHYDSEFPEKSVYQSTKLPEGSLGEMDTGYGDIDYEFINGNKDISEHLVGMEKNYYYINGGERQLNNYWHDYDQERSANMVKKYLNLLQKTLDGRDADEEFLDYDGKVLKEILFALKSGTSAQTNDVNIGYLMPEDYIPGTSTELLRDKIYEDLGTAWDFVKFNGKTVPQHLFEGLEDASYTAAGKFPALITSLFPSWISMPVVSYFSGLETRGKEYQDRLDRGYTPQQARTYANNAAIEEFVEKIGSDLAGQILGQLWEKAFEDEGMRTLGKILDKTDWMGLTEKVGIAVQSTLEEGISKKVAGEDKPGTEQLQAAAQSAVAAKAMDKIFNQMKADPEALSLDLRQSLLQALKDPATRQAIEKNGTFTPGQLEAITAGLENAGDQDEGIGTYVGDILYGPTGFAINKQELIPLAEEAFHNRGNYDNDPTARALYERYMR